MSQRPLTPEQVISQMSYDELRELLSELSMDSSLDAAKRFKKLVDQLGQFEAAIEAINGPPTMRDAA